MPLSSHATSTERARPLLGTRVAIRVEGFEPCLAHALIDCAFERIACVHRLMSFHEADSDLGRLHRAAVKSVVQVDVQTWQVLDAALRFAAASSGCFDISVARTLVAKGILPRPENSQAPADDASWRDIELLPDHCVRFRRPLWIDLGGIAKGYAVDSAIDALREGGARQACVNAGGDLRVIGPETESVHLLGAATASALPVVEVRDAALASSGGDGAHLHGVTRADSGERAHVTVVAPDCMTADALTKVVLADFAIAQRLLPQYSAVAYFHHPDTGWQTAGAPNVSPC